MNSHNFSFADTRHAHFDAQPRPLPAQIKTEFDLDEWRAEHAAAALQVTDLEAERRRSLARASVDAIRQMDDKLITARIRVERAVAVVADAEAKLAEQTESRRAMQPERRRKHVAALKARDEAERIVREVYGPAAQTIADALTQLAGLETIIEGAGDPPEGETRVPSYEAFRQAGERYHEALAKTVVLPPVVRTDPNFWPPQR